jgi:hypothetical protein
MENTQRQIKFRVWDGAKLMYDPQVFPEDHKLNRIFAMMGTDWEFDQFTGLLDKNGKEIWEGDIVDGRRYWRPKLFGRRVARMDSLGLNDLERWHNDIEIIGNIHENPDLIESGANHKEA